MDFEEKKELENQEQENVVNEEEKQEQETVTNEDVKEEEGDKNRLQEMRDNQIRPQGDCWCDTLQRYVPCDPFPCPPGN